MKGPVIFLGFWFVSIIGFAGYNIWLETSVVNFLNSEALNGNEHAIFILRTYDKPWKLNKIILEEAVKGNPNALKILKIEIKEKK